MIEEAYFGVDGAPIVRKDIGAAKLTTVYDARGNAVEEAYFGVEGAPIASKNLGTAKLTTVYDARGNAVEQAYFGVDGAPILDKDIGAGRNKPGSTTRAATRSRKRILASTARRSCART